MKNGSMKKLFLRWEMLLILVLLALNVLLAIKEPTVFFKKGTITSMVEAGLNLCPLVMGMSLVMIIGKIDVCCVANVCVCAYVTGSLCEAGAAPGIAYLVGIIVSVLLGMFAGLLVGYLEFPPVVTTIALSLAYRGCVRGLMGTNVLRTFPKFYNALMWRDILGIPYCAIAFTVIAILFTLLLHKTRFGRSLFMIGNNAMATEYSGINVKRVIFQVYVIAGFMAGVCSAFFVGRTGGGMTASMGTGSEMQVIATTALGGVAADGGSGTIPGAFIATFIMAATSYFLGLMGVEEQGRKIFMGIILIIAVVVTNSKETWLKEKLSGLRRKQQIAA